MKRNTEKANRKQTADKAKPRVDIKTNVKAGACCNSGWSDRNVKENFALVDGLDVLATVLED
ncbi:hypothetical protein [Candidatus Entotheonella palauensis]|uniref:Uncharacterized protein n=1 Tax=Candidatus Entotheonella gemina TaxID=1429439 RepID=W4MBB4_9BACT|nr:hypothetical protein [Candidatus Entotheonella palauensis]ETX07475.1 MAG: hypothetical protein ETSY2_10985 [Candidatus Entotheonella gemina]